MQLVLDTHGLVVKVRNRRFHIIMRRDPKAAEGSKPEQRFISPEQLSSIAVIADCMLSTAAIRLAVEHEIPIYLLDGIGNIEAKLWSPYFVGLAVMRRAQALWHESDQDHAWVGSLVALKIERQHELLTDWPDVELKTDHEALKDQAKALVPDETQEAMRTRMLTLEAQAARAYWPALAAVCPSDWRFEERSRRPAQDPFNAALNYLYGMLYPVVEGAVFAAGLDPYMGMLHAEEYDRPALAFDLIEPFRPWVDALLLDLCHSGKLDIRDFEPKDGGWWVGKPAKAVIIPAFNDFIKMERIVAGDNRSVKNHIHAFAAQLATDIKTWYDARAAPTP